MRDRFLLADMTVEFDVQFGQLVVTPSERIVMLRLAVRLTERLIAGFARGLDGLARLCVRVIVMRLLVRDLDHRLAGREFRDFQLRRFHLAGLFDLQADPKLVLL